MLPACAQHGRNQGRMEEVVGSEVQGTGQRGQCVRVRSARRAPRGGLAASRTAWRGTPDVADGHNVNDDGMTWSVKAPQHQLVVYL
eukprot:3705126-Prymnesium_polylepis.1